MRYNYQAAIWRMLSLAPIRTWLEGVLAVSAKVAKIEYVHAVVIS